MYNTYFIKHLSKKELNFKHTPFKMSFAGWALVEPQVKALTVYPMSECTQKEPRCAVKQWMSTSNHDTPGSRVLCTKAAPVPSTQQLYYEIPELFSPFLQSSEPLTHSPNAKESTCLPYTGTVVLARGTKMHVCLSSCPQWTHSKRRKINKYIQLNGQW